MSLETPTTPTDAAQNRAISSNRLMLIIVSLIAIFSLCMSCGLVYVLFTGPIQNPLQTRPLWNVPQTEVPATPTPTVAVTAVSCANSDKAFIVGGRLDDKGKGYEWIAVVNLELLKEGTPLQQTLEMVTDDSFKNILDLVGTHEVFNDGAQYLIVQENCVWVAYVMPRETSNLVPFWSISWIKYDAVNGVVVICKDDAGSPGDWVGACAGATESVSSKLLLSDLMSSSLFSPWADKLKSAMEAFDGKIFNNRIAILETFRQK